jgi:hypothetical protein
MSVSAIIIRTGGPAEAARVRSLIDGEPRCTPGPARGGDLAAVLEFETAEDGEALHARLHALPGVRVIDVVATLLDPAGRLPHEGAPP